MASRPRRILTVMIHLLWLNLQAAAVAQPICVPHLLGSPDHEACQELLTGTYDVRGISRIDRKSHLFHASAETMLVQERPPGVTRQQHRNRVVLPQPRYSAPYSFGSPPMSPPRNAPEGQPVPWENGELGSYLCRSETFLADKVYMWISRV
ncbi:MAG: hypothetical protein Q9219_003926 [cf. Caloplaca sp. 3 TL-2023]